MSGFPPPIEEREISTRSSFLSDDLSLSPGTSNYRICLDEICQVHLNPGLIH